MMNIIIVLNVKNFPAKNALPIMSVSTVYAKIATMNPIVVFVVTVTKKSKQIKKIEQDLQLKRNLSIPVLMTTMVIALIAMVTIKPLLVFRVVTQVVINVLSIVRIVINMFFARIAMNMIPVVNCVIFVMVLYVMGVCIETTQWNVWLVKSTSVISVLYLCMDHVIMIKEFVFLVTNKKHLYYCWEFYQSLEVIFSNIMISVALILSIWRFV